METSAQRKIRMDELIKIFADTQLFYKTDSVLIEAVQFGKQHTKLYQADDYSKITWKRVPPLQGRGTDKLSPCKGRCHAVTEAFKLSKCFYYNNIFYKIAKIYEANREGSAKYDGD